MPAGGSLRPARLLVDRAGYYAKQDGQAVLVYDCGTPGTSASGFWERNQVTADQLDLFVSHQANHRIIMSAAERIRMPEDKVIINIEDFGNTTAATIPLALNTAVEAGRLKKGDHQLLASVGAGFTVGSKCC
jgi:3-oxoacyl-[acyl-carrier-protein] synthase-3